MDAITADMRRLICFLPPGALSHSSLPPAIQADEGRFVFDNRMAGYGGEADP
jgi:hypothetical protein